AGPFLALNEPDARFTATEATPRTAIFSGLAICHSHPLTRDGEDFVFVCFHSTINITITMIAATPQTIHRVVLSRRT
ncbi:MAG: hypothetical protein J6V72_00880, partial [Kiritimatiellae bacterium]|nr:hypothetical protein [Kiritimatiellia bacterium]